MKKRADEYKAYIIDLDGTLYFQRPLRLSMLKELICFYLLHPFKIKELFALKEYRSIREKRMYAEEEDFSEKQILYLADRFKMDPGYLRNMLVNWMEEVPLKYIKKYRNKDLIAFLEKKRNEGAVTVVYSDYPVSAKLEALEFRPDQAFYSADPEIGCMKPDEKGLLYIISMLGEKKEDILFIGDRQEKDGECARRAGVDFLFLNKGRFHEG